MRPGTSPYETCTGRRTWRQPAVLVDAGFLIALLSRRERHHGWAVAVAERFPPPWRTCEPALSEASDLLGSRGLPALAALLRRGAVLVAFDLAEHLEPTLKLMERYAGVPMALADACLVRMTEILPDPVLLTTDADFHVYRRHSRHTIPAELP